MGAKMKKRLCLFMMSLLLFMSVGCSQVAPQTPETIVSNTSESASGPVATAEPNENPETDADKAAADSDDGSSSAAREESFPDSPDAGFNESSSGHSEEFSLPDTSNAGFRNPDAIDSSSSGLAEDVSGLPDNFPSLPEDTSSLPEDVPSLPEDTSSLPEDAPSLPEDGAYTSKEDVALYIHLYGHLPPNFITKKEAEKLGWKGGSLEPYAPGMCIGGSRFGNYEGLLPQADGRSYTECDIDTLGADKRGAKRIVFSNDGLIYYTEDHYKSFELLYGEADP